MAGEPDRMARVRGRRSRRQRHLLARGRRSSDGESGRECGFRATRRKGGCASVCMRDNTVGTCRSRRGWPDSGNRCTPGAQTLGASLHIPGICAEHRRRRGASRHIDGEMLARPAQPDPLDVLAEEDGGRRQDEGKPLLGAPPERFGSSSGLDGWRPAPVAHVDNPAGCGSINRHGRRVGDRGVRPSRACKHLPSIPANGASGKRQSPTVQLHIHAKQREARSSERTP